ncbi:MAG: hypothetical protein JWR23_3492 [Mucilaginibacter sp.]|nr:hypothetical protein [Mucilaginibacter sp.]
MLFAENGLLEKAIELACILLFLAHADKMLTNSAITIIKVVVFIIIIFLSYK